MTKQTKTIKLSKVESRPVEIVPVETETEKSNIELLIECIQSSHKAIESGAKLLNEILKHF